MNISATASVLTYLDKKKRPCQNIGIIGDRWKLLLLKISKIRLMDKNAVMSKVIHMKKEILFRLNIKTKEC